LLTPFWWRKHTQGFCGVKTCWGLLYLPGWGGFGGHTRGLFGPSGAPSTGLGNVGLPTQDAHSQVLPISTSRRHYLGSPSGVGTWAMQRRMGIGHRALDLIVKSPSTFPTTAAE
jgi:hypothetical protein